MKWFLFSEGRLLLEKHADGTYSVPESAEWREEWHKTSDIHRFDGFATAEIKTDDDTALFPLRKTYFLLDSQTYSHAAKCEEILYWDRNTQYCSVCGGKMQQHTAISKCCDCCGREVWPLLSTAIIVRITRGNEILLVHAKTFKHDFYGLVAGFVETGETLEEAVEREVMEETGLTIKNIHYFTSQSWPYPCGLMIGFTAEYDSGDIRLQEDELEKGGWFTKDNLPNIPDKASIARRLIDDWLESSVILS